MQTDYLHTVFIVCVSSASVKNKIEKNNPFIEMQAASMNWIYQDINKVNGAGWYGIKEDCQISSGL